MTHIAIIVAAALDSDGVSKDDLRSLEYLSVREAARKALVKFGG